MIIDTHSHLNFKAYNKDREQVIKRAQEQGVVCIDVGINFETSKKAVELAENNKNIFAAVGMHPIHAKDEEFDRQKYLDLAKSKKVVVIGEIGLDNKFKNEKQKQVFLQHLGLAIELELPVILHCRMAHTDLIEILKSHSNLRGVLHCFTGSVEEMEQYLELGFYIGFNGIVFKLPLDEVIKGCPMDKILVETDCPYLTPLVEGKNTRNEPVFVKHVIQKMADLKGLTFDEIAKKTTQNAKALFKI